ncbi:MAG: M15 family metallopeptidase [Brevinema sp.]
MNIYFFFLLSFITLGVLQTQDTPIASQEISSKAMIRENEDKLGTEIMSTSENSVLYGNLSVENIFHALLQSYPHIVKAVPQSENPYHTDLAINVRGTNFYNVHGRFLPEQERDNWEKYSSNALYIYTKVIPNPALRSLEEINLMKTQGSTSYRKKKKQSYYGFHEALYGMKQISDTNKQIMKTRFLGKQVLIHQFAYSALQQVEKEIYGLTNNAVYGREVRKFLKEGDTVYSFFWRNIAGSKSRSLHSYGVAVDVLEANSKKAMYWLWRQDQKIDWIREPISVRWNPPHSVVHIFEKYGFVWGGKWNFYDTMHFEYKPEILLVNGYKVKFLTQEHITQ